MAEEVTLEVSNIHEQMLTEVKDAVSDGEFKSQAEQFIHDLYQAVEQEKRKQRELQKPQLQQEQEDA